MQMQNILKFIFQTSKFDFKSKSKPPTGGRSLWTFRLIKPAQRKIFFICLAMPFHFHFPSFSIFQNIVSFSNIAFGKNHENDLLLFSPEK